MSSNGQKRGQTEEESSIFRKRHGHKRKWKKHRYRVRERERASLSQIRLGQFVVTQRLPFAGITTVNDVWQAHPYYWLSFTHARKHTHSVTFPASHKTQNIKAVSEFYHV